MATKKAPTKRTVWPTTGPDATIYSEWVAGSAGNCRQRVQYDRTRSGYVGITQDTGDDLERVLLSPAQVRALLVFMGPR